MLSKLASILSTLHFLWLTLITTLFIISLSILSIINNRFVSSIYKHISSDSYGLNDDSRFELATVAVTYLLSNEPPKDGTYMLSNQELPDGSPLYTAEEIAHMIDVKQLTDTIRRLPPIALITYIIFLVTSLFIPLAQQSGVLGYKIIRFRSQKVFLIYRRGTYLQKVFQATRKGAIISCIFGIGLFLFALLFWRQFFVLFHELFFPPDSWTFDPTSGLIRLFPESFWFFLGLTLIGRIVLFSIVGYGLILLAQFLHLLSHYFMMKRYTPLVLFQLFGITIMPFGFLTSLLNFSMQIHQLQFNFFYVLALLFSLLMTYLPYRDLHREAHYYGFNLLNEYAVQFSGVFIFLCGLWTGCLLKVSHPFLVFVSSGFLMAIIAFFAFGVLPLWNEVVSRQLFQSVSLE